MLSLEQEDILKELMNIFVGEAASLLSEITNKKIHLSVPQLSMISSKDKNIIDSSKIPELLSGTLLASSLRFGDKFKGKAELIFPTDKIKFLTKLCIEETDETDEGMNIDDTDFDVMMEIGNIILNSIIGGIGNLINIKLEYHIPEIEIFDIINYKKRFSESDNLYFLMLYVSFEVDEIETIGIIVINFIANSISFLIEKIDAIRDELYV